MTATALHFGTSGRELFGVYHAAETAAPSRPAVLLCNPFGQEAVRTHRIYRILAERLARAGHNVLRFDYFATGDSAGDCAQGHLSQWHEDVLTAHDELRDMSSARKVVWLGLRLGAAIAVVAAAAAPSGLSGLVLWDPVADGSSYLDELAQGHINYLANALGDPPATVAARIGATARGREAIGFELSDKLVKDLRSLELKRRTARLPKRIWLIEDGDAANSGALAAIFEKSGAAVTRISVDGDVKWNSDSAMNAFVVPTKVLDDIVGSLGAA